MDTHAKLPARRTFLTSAIAVAATSLAGCSIDWTVPGFTSDAKLVFPNFPGELPSGNTTFRWIDSGDLKGVYIGAVLKAFQEAHPNVTTQYDGAGWDTVNQVVSLGIRNNSAPDVFALPQNVEAGIAINQGWVAPLDEVIPEFASWKSKFPELAFVPGIHTFGDKTYSWPLNSTRRLQKMVFYDSQVMDAAGISDPVRDISTWEDLARAAESVKNTGKAGLMVGGAGDLATTVRGLAFTANWRATNSGLAGFDYITGNYAYDAPEFLQAATFLKELIDNGLVVPGFLTINEADARAQMPASRAGMIFNGPWDIPAWKKTAPNWKYAIAQVPSPDGNDYVVPFNENGANMTFLYSRSTLPDIAGQLYAYMGSVEGQSQMVLLSEGNLVSLIPEANALAAQSAERLDPNAQRAADLAVQLMRACPQVERRNPNIAQVKLALKPVTPNIENILQGHYSGQISDLKGALSAYNDAMNQALEDAITAANNQGTSIKASDFVFANWDPTKDFTNADY